LTTPATAAGAFDENPSGTLRRYRNKPTKTKTYHNLLLLLQNIMNATGVKRNLQNMEECVIDSPESDITIISISEDDSSIIGREEINTKPQNLEKCVAQKKELSAPGHPSGEKSLKNILRLTHACVFHDDEEDSDSDEEEGWCDKITERYYDLIDAILQDITSRDQQMGRSLRRRLSGRH
jgi:hypothetical protein